MSSAANDGSPPVGGSSGVQDISSLRARIQATQTSLVKLFQDSEDAARLIDLVQSSTDVVFGRFDSDEERILPNVLSDIERVATTLEDIQGSVLQSQKILGLRCRKRKCTFEDFRGWQDSLETALKPFSTSDDSTEIHGTGPSTSMRPDGHQTQSSAHRASSDEHRAKKKSRHGEYALEAAEAVFALAARAAECAPAPFGTAAKGIFATAKDIVKALKDVKSNREAVERLQNLVTDYTKRITGFLDEVDDANDPILQDAALVASLNTFQERFAALAAKTLKITSDGKWKQALKHTLNKSDLDRFSVELEDVFQELKFQLHLNATKSIRWLECQRLLDILGGADNGATSKATRPEDLLCQQGTREGVLDDIKSWVADPASGNVLWISGVAGSGKTAIAATVANQQTLAGACVAIFHFNRSTQQRNGSAVRSLARMLALSKVKQVTAAILAGVRRLQESSSDFLSVQFDRVIATPLGSLSADSKPVICIVDALDEWEDLKGAAELFRLISTRKLPSLVKFVITSRRDRHLEVEFNRNPPSCVRRYDLDKLSHDVVTADIRVLLETELARMRYSGSIAVEEWPGSEVLDRLAHMAQGLFQWAVTICRYIEAGYHQENLNAVLSLSSDSAQDLDDVYRLVIHRFTSTRGCNVRLMNEALGCLVVAPTPMGLGTLAYILKGPSECALVALERLKGAVLSHLRALLVIPDDVDEPIRFLHSSILDLLTDPGRCTEAAVAVNIEDHNARIARCCFHVMARDLQLHIPETTEHMDADETQCRAIKLTSTSLRYVARYWPEYVLRLSPNSARIVQHGLGTLLGDFTQRLVLAWIEGLACMQEVDTAASFSFLLERWVTNVDRAGVAKASLMSRTAYPGSLLDVASIFRETQQLIAAFHEALSSFSSNLYHTLRTWLPLSTRLHGLYSELLPARVKVIRGPSIRTWSPCIWQARQEGLSSMALSRDGDHMVCGNDKGVIYLWSTTTLKEVGAPVDLEMGGVREAVFGAAGTIFAATRRGVVLWRMKTKEKEVLQESEGIWWNCVATSSDDCKIVAGGEENLLYLWEEVGGKPPRKLEGHSDWVLSVAFSPDDTLIASGSEDETIRIWNVSAATQRGMPFEGHSDGVTSVAFSPDGRTLVSGSADATIRLWIVETGETKWKIRAPFNREWDQYTVAFSGDGSTIALGSEDRTVRLWDAETGEAKGKTVADHSLSVNSMIFTSDGRAVISGTADGTIRMWDVSGISEPLSESLRGHSRTLSGIAFSPDGQFIATVFADRTLRLWDAETGEASGSVVDSDRLACVAFSPNGQWVASGNCSGTIQIWDATTLIPVGDPIHTHSGWVRSVSFSPDSTAFVSVSDSDGICLWDVSTRQRIGGPFSHGWRSDILSVDFTRQGRHLIYSFSSGVLVAPERTIYLLDATSFTHLGKLTVPPDYCRGLSILSDDDTAIISNGYALDVRGILDGTCTDATLIPGMEVVFQTMRSDITVPMWIDERGWITLAGKPFLWVPPDYGRGKSCWWRRGIIVIDDPRVLILDARNVPLG